MLLRELVLRHFVEMIYNAVCAPFIARILPDSARPYDLILTLFKAHNKDTRAQKWGQFGAMKGALTNTKMLSKTSNLKPFAVSLQKTLSKKLP